MKISSWQNVAIRHCRRYKDKNNERVRDAGFTSWDVLYYR